uniref:Uncharacterized protein n=1 Tax=Strigamia maritima TaxID=126957 RepID=T1IIS8_STRMM
MNKAMIILITLCVLASVLTEEQVSGAGACRKCKRKVNTYCCLVHSGICCEFPIKDPDYSDEISDMNFYDRKRK